MIVYAGVPYTGNNDTLAFISSLTAHSSSNSVEDSIEKKALRLIPNIV